MGFAGWFIIGTFGFLVLGLTGGLLAATPFPYLSPALIIIAIVYYLWCIGKALRS
jgi:hypothetical protein